MSDASTGNATTVQLTTVHNWVELVYKAFGQTLPTGAKEMAILGVREASLGAKGATLPKTDGKKGKKAPPEDPTKTLETLEDTAAQGKTDDVSFTRGSREGSMSDAATAWDDLLFVVWTDSDAAKTQHVDVYECTIDPGKASGDAVGMPFLLEGKLYKGYPGSHIAKKYPGNDIALHLYTGSKGKILLAREATKTMRIFKELKSANVRSGKFVMTEDNDSVHMHFGSSTSTAVGGWSEGCTVLRHKLDSERYKHFKKSFNDASNKQQIPYLVVSSKYVRLYDEWVKEVDKTPGQQPEAKTVVIKEELVSPTGVEGKYLPSIMTKEFADAVKKEADGIVPADFQGPPQAKDAKNWQKAANMRSSLEQALFTVSI